MRNPTDSWEQMARAIDKISRLNIPQARTASKLYRRLQDLPLTRSDYRETMTWIQCVELIERTPTDIDRNSRKS